MHLHAPTSEISRLRRAGVICLLAILAMVAGLTVMPGVASADDVSLPTPLRDTFYSTPANIASVAPGAIISARRMPNPAAFYNVVTYQLKFRSNDSQGRPISAVTTLVRPVNARANAPLLSYQHIINGVGLECAPSQELYTSDPNLIIREAPALNAVFARGWAVALPDHLGPKSAYGAAKLGGQITLDGIRAAQAFAPAQLSKSPVALAGYSGGGMATAWAAALAPTYAPELRIVGSAQGGVPMNLLQMALGLGYNTPHPAFGLAFAAAIGLSREYPAQIPIRQNLSPLGRSIYTRMRNACTNDVLALGAGHSGREMVKNVGIFDDKVARAVVDENSLELYPGVPKAPIFEWHSPTDVLIPVGAIDRTDRRYCRSGVRLTKYLTPSPDHLSAAVIGLPAAIDWISARFAGRPAPSTC